MMFDFYETSSNFFLFLGANNNVAGNVGLACAADELQPRVITGSIVRIVRVQHC